MAKELKIWNGRIVGNKYNRGHIFVAAYSVKQAVELINEACGAFIGPSEINNYYSKGAWGNSMEGIIPTEPCVYVQIGGFSEKPVKII